MIKGVFYVCESCGYESSKWLGKCPNCSSWASFVEYKKPSLSASIRLRKAKEPVYLKDVKGGQRRIKTNIYEMDRVLGGGFVPGQILLLAGDPGVGKSTLLLQIASNMRNSFYVLGEESLNQVSTRAERIGAIAKNIAFLEETDINVVVATLDKWAKKTGEGIVIIDSVQTMYSKDLTGVAGSVGQVKETTFRLIEFAKRTNIPVVLVGHVTKDGTVAGPSTLAHMVDAVLWLEGDKVSSLRILRSYKNRFAPTDEVGIFHLSQSGMQSALDTESLFLSKNISDTPGSVVSCVMEGTRPILIELQALVVPTKLAFPRRVVHGIDSKRIEILIAVLTRHCGLKVAETDVFINVAGGIKIKDPGVDLAVAFAIASSYKNKHLDKKTLVVGEVGLLGEIRKSAFEERRLELGRRQGYIKSINSSNYKTVSSALSTISMYNKKLP